MNVSNRERGAVMVWSLIFVIVIAGMIISHSAYMASHRRTMDVHLKRKPLAANFARAALTDGLSWFQAQATQPVAEFAPQRNLMVDPPILDTDDPTIGLVREFEIRGNLWGRYEIRRSEVMDTSLQYGISAPGSVWDLAARAYVWRVNDPRKPFDQPPNRILSTSRLDTSIRTVPLDLPASAAIGIDDVTRLTIGPGGRVIGGVNTPGVATLAVDPLPAVLPSVLASLSSIVVGNPTVVLLPVYESSPTQVFRMSLPELRDISDIAVVGALDSWLAQPVPGNQLVFHDGDLTIAAAERLTGSMLLVVNGNLVVEAGSNSRINGVVFVTGNIELRGPFTLNGMLVAKGSVLLQGNGVGQDATVEYDALAVQRLLQSLSRYRASRVLRNRDSEVVAGLVSATPTIGGGTTVAPSAEFAPGVTLGSGVQIEDLVKVGAGTTVSDNTLVRSEALLGEKVLIGSSVQLGTRARIDDFAVVGDGAVIGSGATIGSGARIAAGATVPANAVVRAGASYP